MLVALIALALLAFSASTASAAMTVTAISNVSGSLATLTTNISNNTPATLNSQYLGFKVVNDSTARTDLWVTISGVSGGNVVLAPGENGSKHFGAVAGSATVYSYFYFRSSATTATDTTFAINLYNGVPGAGGTLISTSNATITDVIGVQNASANKVLSGYVTPAAPTLGANFNIVINGNTGTMRNNEAGVFTPAFGNSWDPSKFELIATSIKFDTVTRTFTNQLAFTAVSGTPSTSAPEIRKAGHLYTATYTFRAVNRTDASVKPTPVALLPSGSLLKYTSASSLGLIGPISPVSNAFLLTASVSPARSANGQLVYTLTLQNTSTRTLSVDTISDILPAGTTYQAGTSRYNGALIVDPNIASGTLTWSGPFTVSGGSRVTLSYQTNVTPTTTSTAYTDSATAMVGPTQIDTTLITTDNAPATATAIVNSGFADDTAAPTITLTAKDGANATIANAGTTTSTAATMIFTANESASYTCSLDGATPSACASPYALSGLPTGLHTFYVYATDAAGNVGTATITWTITDSTPPTVISFTPAQSTAKTSPIQFSLKFSEPVTGLLAADLSAVTSGSPGTWTVESVVGDEDTYAVTLSSASPGTSGTIQARLAANTVADLSSNTGPTASADSGTVTLRSTLAVEITDAAPTNSTTSKETSATFTFSETATSYPASRFQCSMVTTGSAASYSECTSPVTYTGNTTGPYTFSLKAEDVTTADTGAETINATSAVVTSAWTVDATPPVVTVTSPTAGQTVTSATPTINGACTSGDGTVTVRLYGGNSSAATLLQTLSSPCVSEAWSVVPTELVSDTYTATARQTDAVGNTTTTADRTFAVQTTAPKVTVGVPEQLIKVTSSPVSGVCTSTQDGRAMSDVTVTLTKGATTITRTATCGVVSASSTISVAAVGDGTYTTDATGLSDGTYIVASTQTDTTNDLVGSSLTTTLVVDTTPPAVTITSPANGTRISSLEPTITGACEYGTGDDIVTVSFVDGAVTKSATAKCVADGTYSAYPTGSEILVNGTTYTVTSSQTDTAGNVGTSSSISLTVDTTAPTVTITSPLTDTDATTNPTVTGACESGPGSGDGSITVNFVTGATTKIANGVCSEGTYAATPSGDNSLSVDSTYTVVAQQTDTAGNKGNSAAITITVTTVAVAVDLVNASDTGISNSDDLTYDNTPTISVSGLGGAAATVTATKSGSSNVTCAIAADVTQCDLTTLVDGSWSIYATPASGSASSAITVRIDTVAPVTSGSITATTTNSTSVAVNYTATDAIGVDSVTAQYSTSAALTAPTSCGTVVSAATSGSIGCTIPATDATYYMYTIGSDAAGNTEAAPGSGAADDSIIRNTIAVTVDLATASDTGQSHSDDLTNDNTPTISVSGLEGAAATVTATKSDWSNVTCSLAAGVTQCDLGLLADGSWSITATPFGGAQSGALPITIDTTVPAVTIAAPSTGSSTNTREPTITGACTNGDGLVTVTFTPATGDPLSITAECVGGTYTASVPAPNALADGAYSIVAAQTDGAGSIGSSSTVTLTIDTTGPTVETFTTTATSPTGAQSIPYRIVFSEPVSGVESSDFDLATGLSASSGWIVTSAVGSGATWMITLTATTPTNGTVTPRILAVTVGDALGNVGPPGIAAGQQIVYDATSTNGVAPITTITNTVVTNDNRDVTFEFVASEPATFECRIDSGAWETCTSPKAYTDHGTGAHLDTGAHLFEVRATDLDGMISEPAAGDWAVATASTSDPAAATAATRTLEPKLEIDVKLPEIVQVAKTFTVILEVRNVGEAPADTLRVSMSVPQNVTIITVRIIGVSPLARTGVARRLRVAAARQDAPSPCSMKGREAVCNSTSLDPQMRYRLEVDIRLDVISTDVVVIAVANTPQTTARAFDVQRVLHVAPKGVRCTIMGRGIIRGTAGDDVICGSPQHDTIFGFGGNDVIYAGSDNDLVYAGTGNDRVLAGAGDDLIDAGAGNDIAKGNAGRDRILGRQGDDTLGGGPGVDEIHSGIGALRLMGVSNADTHWLVTPGASYPYWKVYGPSGRFIEHLVPAADICNYATC